MEEIVRQFSGKLLLPGDIICNTGYYESIDKLAKPKMIGPGLCIDYENKNVVVTQAGYLCLKSNDKIWINSIQKKYIPHVGDRVIGLIQKTGVEYFSVDIGAIRHAHLDSLSFEGATKRNRPHLNVGDVVYARVISADSDCEPVISCIESNEKANGLGCLSNSSNNAIYHIGCSFAKKLLDQKCSIIEQLKQYQSYSYEITIGVNGKLWIQSMSAFVSNKIGQFFLNIRSIGNEKLIEKAIRTYFDI